MPHLSIWFKHIIFIEKQTWKGSGRARLPCEALSQQSHTYTPQSMHPYNFIHTCITKIIISHVKRLSVYLLRSYNWAYWYLETLIYYIHNNRVHYSKLLSEAKHFFPSTFQYGCVDNGFWEVRRRRSHLSCMNGMLSHGSVNQLLSSAQFSKNHHFKHKANWNEISVKRLLWTGIIAHLIFSKQI